MAKRKKRIELELLTRKITEAFEAALKLYDVWESPDGPAYVVDVCIVTIEDKGTYWCITYRVLKHWGKEAWNR